MEDGRNVKIFFNTLEVYKRCISVHSPVIMAPQREGTSKSVLYLIFFPQLSFMMSPKQHISEVLLHYLSSFYQNEIKSRHQGANTIRCKSEIFPPTPYFYGADPANIENAVKKFARNGRPKSIGMFFIVLSINKLAAKSKYSMGFGVPPT